jgi:hypothetical protein
LCIPVPKILPRAQILPGKADYLEFMSEQVLVRLTRPASPPAQRPAARALCRCDASYWGVCSAP